MQLNARMRRWLPWLLLAAAVLATITVYWPGVTGGWVFDDYPNIADNAAIHIQPGHANLIAWVNAALSSPSSFLHRPLASITFAVNWYFGGGDIRGFKITNILIHVVNGVLLFCVLRELLRLVALRWPARVESLAATRLALVVAAAWMLLPINLMAVLYVVQRMESLCQVFVLAGLWAYLHGRWMMLTARDSRRDAHGFSLAAGGIVLGTVLGLTSKETAVLLPVFAFLAEAIVVQFGRRANAATTGAAEAAATPQAEPRIGFLCNESASRDQRIWALFTITLFAPAVLGFAWLLRSALKTATWAGRDFTLAQRLLTEPRVLVDYLHWTILPNPAVLSLYHDEIVKSTGILSPWTTLGSIVLLAALLVVAVWQRERHPLVALGIGWFFASQLLTATIVPLELVYEQRMYFGSIGVLLGLGVLLLGLRRQIPMALPRVFVVVVAILWFGTATYLRAREWSNPVMLATQEANRHPESARANYTAGREWMIVAGYRPGEAMTLAKKFLRRTAAIPGASALSDQALIMFADHRRQGDDAALWIAMVSKLRNQPTRQEDISALISLGNCYDIGVCKFDLANLQRAYAAALSRPHPIARLDAAYAQFQRDILQDDALATEYLTRAVKRSPSEPAYRADLAALCAKHGDTECAVEQIDALRRMNTLGRFDGLITTLERAAEHGAVPGPS